MLRDAIDWLLRLGDEHGVDPVAYAVIWLSALPLVSYPAARSRLTAERPRMQGRALTRMGRHPDVDDHPRRRCRTVGHTGGCWGTGLVRHSILDCRTA